MDTSLKQQLKDAGYAGEFDLSSLIDACGERFYQLNRTDEGEWIATGDIDEDRINTDKALGGEFESTPEIAVVNLWLSLNKKP